MQKINQQQLQEILDLHKKWFCDSSMGRKADLSFVDLSGANLSGANLYGTNLSGAN